MEKFWAIPLSVLTLNALYSECLFSDEALKHAGKERHSSTDRPIIAGTENDLVLKGLDEEPKEALGFGEKNETASTVTPVQEVDQQKEQMQETAYDRKSSAESQEDALEQDCRFSAQPYQVNVRHIESKGIGYKHGYTTLDGFFTHQMDEFIPFVDLRGHVFNNGKLAANTGLGMRYVIDPDAYMVGGNFYYDYRDTTHSHYNQIGIGLEAFLTRWEFRANGYLPVGTKRKAYEHDLNWISFKAFSGNNILINENYTDTVESAMRGFNAEAGVHCLKAMCDYDLFVGAGPYYFNADGGKTTWGGKVRVKAEVTKYLYLELSNSYDNVFHNRFQGTVSLSYPFGSTKCCRKKQKAKNKSLPDNPLCLRAVQPPERQEIVVVSKNKKTYTVDPIAIDPTTGQPFFVVFVNNTNTNPAPNGTFENPFANLSTLDGAANAQDASVAGNILYVFAGDGTTTNMANGIALKDAQRFLGSGISNQFTTTKGVLVVPPQTTYSPIISNADATLPIPVVMLTDANEVSGFGISILGGASNSGIETSSVTGGDFVITRNIITGNSTSNTGITARIYHGNLLIDHNIISSTGSGGISTNSVSTGNVTMTISNNMINFVSTSGISVTNQSTSIAYVNIIGNQLESTNTSGGAFGTLLLNALNPSVGTVVSVGNNIISNTNRDGLYAEPARTMSLDVYNNQFTGCGNYGMIVHSPAVDEICLFYTNNISTGNTSGGYSLIQSTGPFNLNINSTGNIGSLTQSGSFTYVSECAP